MHQLTSSEPPADGVALLFDNPPPAIPATAVSAIAKERFGLIGKLQPLPGERDLNFRLSAGDGTQAVIKVSNLQDGAEVLSMQRRALEHVRLVDPDLPVMRQLSCLDGAPWAGVQDGSGKEHLVRAFSCLPGRHLSAATMSLGAIQDLGRQSARLGRDLRGFFDPAAGLSLAWDIRRVTELLPLVPLLDGDWRRSVVSASIDDFAHLALPRLPALRAQLIHNDLSLSNVLFDDSDQVCGILDFGDLLHAPLICDLAVSAESMWARGDGVQALAAISAGYSSVTELEDAELEVLPELLRARWAALALLSTWRSQRYPATAEYVSGWQEGLWEMYSKVEELGVARWRQLVIDTVRPGAGEARAAGLSVASLTARRSRLFGPALSPLFYDRPLHLVRGQGVWLEDAEGGRYLDAYNNVPVVGHCHPRVVAAISRQAALLNTNVRYLHPAALELGERLLATLPQELDTVLFANSGSEANDLAYRLASSFTKAKGAVVTQFAYHGSTTLTAALSPEEWKTAVAPRHVALIPAPDDYSGGHRRSDPNWVADSAAHVERAVEELAARGVGPAALFVDTGWSSEGILTPPASYLQELTRRWHEAGGLLVADEVQMGFGRSGASMWGFEAFGIVPDFVTMGKPMGNGHPVAALVTRREIAERFAATTSWFSTFGGNPVAAAAALAVLDIIEDERLVQNASVIGRRLADGLASLAERHHSIGDIRGRGLLIGVELVRDRSTREPLPARGVVERMRDRGVLIGSTGPGGNVLKIRPPLVAGEDHADLLLTALDRVLTEVEARP